MAESESIYGSLNNARHSAQQIREADIPAAPFKAWPEPRVQCVDTSGYAYEDNNMRKMVRPLLRAMLIIPLLHAVSQANSPKLQPVAQIRTYVSGLGSDTNPCTASFPCQTFQAASAMTTAGGEIYVLDSANYGAVTINKALTITSEGAVAGVLAANGAGITINAGANDVVTLRGLDIDGGNSGSMGIQFNTGGSLNVQNSVVHNFKSSGINFAPSATSTLYVSNTVVTNNVSNGIMVASRSGAVNGTLNRVVTSGNGVGVLAYGAAANVTITDTVAGSNNYGIGVSSSAVMVRNSTVSNNAIGITADQAAIVRVGQTTVTANATGWQATNGGQVQSYGNNSVSGNAVDGTLTNTIALQ